MRVVSDVCLKRDRSNTMTGGIDMAKHRLMNLGGPTAEDDAVNLKYLPAISQA